MMKTPDPFKMWLFWSAVAVILAALSGVSFAIWSPWVSIPLVLSALVALVASFNWRTKVDRPDPRHLTDYDQFPLDSVYEEYDR